MHGEAHIEVFNGKGGKYRAVPVINDVEAVERLCRAAGNGKVFAKVPAAMDVHSYRAQYATDLYRMYARPLEECKRTPFYDPQKKREYTNSVYYFRRDRAGEWLDRAAMLRASRALGHNRICVVGEHYIMT